MLTLLRERLDDKRRNRAPLLAQGQARGRFEARRRRGASLGLERRRGHRSLLGIGHGLSHLKGVRGRETRGDNVLLGGGPWRVSTLRTTQRFVPKSPAPSTRRAEDWINRHAPTIDQLALQLQSAMM